MSRGDLGTPALVGRQYERAAIRSAIDDGARGHGRALVITGEAGIGKSRLVEEALGYARDISMQVVQAVADELDWDRPFGLLGSALELRVNSDDPERSRLAHLIADDDATTNRSSPVRSAGIRFRVEEDLVSVVDEMASSGPLLVALEDLQWADPQSLSTIARLARVLTMSPIVLIVTRRDAPSPSTLLATIDRLMHWGAASLAIGPLEQDDVTDIAVQLVNATPGERFARRLSTAGGNPLFVTEIVAGLMREDALEIEDGIAETRNDTNPSSLTRTVLRRLSALNVRTKAVVRLAAVLGSSFSIDDLVSMTGRAPLDVVSDVEAAAAEGIFSLEADVRFRHDVVRESIYADIPESIRKAIHLQVARSLAAAGSSPTRVAAHMSVGAESGDRDAVRWLRDAARSRAQAPDARVELLKRALSIIDPDDPERPELLGELAVALAWAVRPAEAEEVAHEVFATTTERRIRASVRMALGHALLLGARWTEAERCLLDVLEEQDGSERFVTLAARSIALTSAGDLEGARAAATEAIEGGRRTANAGALTLGQHALGMVCFSEGDVPGVELMTRRSVSDVEDEFDEQPLFWRLVDKAMFLLDIDEIEGADEELSKLGSLAQRTRAAPVEYMRHVWLARRHYYIGDWDDAIAESEAGLAFADENGVSWGWMALRPGLARIALHRDQLDLAEQVLPTEAELSSRGPNQSTYWTLLTWALLREAQGDLEGAFEFARRAHDITATNTLVMWYPTFATDFVRLALAAGRLDEARMCVDRLQPLLERLQFPSAQGSMLRALGLVNGNTKQLLQAVDVHRRGPRPDLLARAAEDAGAALSPAPQGVDLLREAAGIFEKLGATRDIARVAAHLRAAGVRAGARGRRNRPVSGWESLTPSELRVSTLVARGLSNPEIASRLFISRYTVQTHLQHVFAKLAVSSRLELAARAIREGVEQGPD